MPGAGRQVLDQCSVGDRTDQVHPVPSACLGLGPIGSWTTCESFMSCLGWVEKRDERDRTGCRYLYNYTTLYLYVGDPCFWTLHNFDMLSDDQV